jgi:hypothetical protein
MSAEPIHTMVRILAEGRSLDFLILLGLPGDARAWSSRE